MKSATLAKSAALAAGAAVVLSGCSAAAADYPSQPISVIVPVPAGSSTDLATRLVTPCLESELGTTIVVENRDGGSGAIGNGEFVRSRADGYTLVSTTAANAVLPELLQGGAGFNAESFLPIGMLGEAPIVLVARDSVDVEDLLSDPGALIGIPGATSVPGIVLQSLVGDHDVPATAVPFDGNGGTINALLGGEVDAALVSADSGVVLPRISDGEIVPLATAIEEPMATLPELPTLASFGYEGLPYANSFWFLGAQTETDAAIVETLSTALASCMGDADVVQSLGEGVAPAEFIDGDAVAELLREAEAAYAEQLVTQE